MGSKAKMKLFSFFALAVAVMAQDYDDLGNKKKGKEEVVDKGPRECKGVKIVDTATTKYKCKSRQADQRIVICQNAARFNVENQRALPVPRRSTAIQILVGFSAKGHSSHH